MNIKSFVLGLIPGSKKNSESESVVFHGSDVAYGHVYPIVKVGWDGEKTLGELGVIKRTVPDYKRLRLRMYHAYATIDTIKIIASKFFYWTIGTGLKLQSEPDRAVLDSEGIINDDAFYTKFQKLTESRFSVYANSKNVDYSKESNLHTLALNAYQGEFLGGDMLCVVRYEDYGPVMQVISGEHVYSPEITEKYFEEAKQRGNKIKHGIELDSRGGHVAYYVCTDENEICDKFERIPAFGEKFNNRLAWMVSGKKISPDHVRAVPQMSQSLEKVNKLDRYTEATVTKAEQGANVVYTIEHQDFSTGESIFQQELNKKKGINTITGTEIDKNHVLGDGLANKISVQTSGKAYNMPNGSKLSSFQSEAESKYKEFKDSVFDDISAGSDVPPEVALQKYNSNYSASRAAINSFGHITIVNRLKFANDFYLPFYRLWLEFEILTNKISAPGYIENRTNFMITESYSKCRFTGKNMPHIDPLKEIKAIREMLGLSDATPLISREQAVEMLDAGQWDENFLKYLEEENIIPKEVVEEKNNNTKK
ncbi:putative portal protein [Flavobacterium phage FL-1]|nr:putative portal protein [Flavobacterium phage FL-1]